MELISPTEIAKEKVLAVQEYLQLASRSVANLFRKPLYMAGNSIEDVARRIEQGLDPAIPAVRESASTRAPDRSAAPF